MLTPTTTAAAATSHPVISPLFNESTTLWAASEASLDNMVLISVRDHTDRIGPAVST